MRANSWLTPPSRREITTLLFATVVFIFSYNIHFSLDAAGIDARAALQATTKKLGLPASLSSPSSREDSGLDPDGRRTEYWRDKIEDQIVGTWRWAEGRTAEGTGKVPVGEGDKYLDGSIWRGEGVGKGGILSEHDDDVRGWALQATSDGLVKLESHFAPTRVVQHFPGYTILDSLYLHKGVIYVVTDDRTLIPDIGEMYSSAEDLDASPTASDWQILSTAQARQKFGNIGAVIHGVSWLATGPSSYQDPHTLLSLWRTYSSLDRNIPRNGLTKLQPALRLIFPHIPIHVDLPPGADPALTMRAPEERSFRGFHPYFAKAVLPALNVQHYEDWKDLATSPTSFVFQRIVVADRGAALRHPMEGGDALLPEWAAPYLTGKSSEHWFAPLRANLLAHLNVQDPREKTKPVVTYMSRQADKSGPRLTDESHQALVKALKKLGNEVNVIDDKTPWMERMRAIVRSTVVLGLYSEAMVDGLFLRPSDHATVIEIFPRGAFMRETEIPARAIGLHYVAVWENEHFLQDSLPPVVFPGEPTAWAKQSVSVDAAAASQVVREALSG